MEEALDVIGYYYLHVNGSLIYKTNDIGTLGDLLASDFVKAFWPVNIATREDAWTIAVEAMAAGALKSQLNALALDWALTNDDAKKYAARVGLLLEMDGLAYVAKRGDFVDLMESPAGFGHTALEAMANLARLLGYRARKGNKVTFKILLKYPGMDAEKGIRR